MDVPLFCPAFLFCYAVGAGLVPALKEKFKIRAEIRIEHYFLDYGQWIRG